MSQLHLDDLFRHTLIRLSRCTSECTPTPRGAPSVGGELRRRLLWLICGRAVILFAALNASEWLGILPPRLGAFATSPLVNVFAASISVAWLGLWWWGRALTAQIYLQIAIDLIVTTALVALTRGIESAFVAFYLLIVIYCSLMLGRNAGTVAAALSTVLYSGLIIANALAMAALQDHVALNPLTYRVSFHALGFFAVAFLGTHLSYRLRAVQEELEEKIDSLRELQRLNEHIVSSIRSGLVTTDLQGQIAVFNSTAEELTERSSGQALFTPVQSILGPGLWDRITSSDLFRSARPLRHEDWVALPGGSRRYMGFSVSPLVDQGRTQLGYIISFQDLTEIKRLEEQVRVEDRLAAVGRMAAGIAHEIRNPLTSMRGSVELLRSRLTLTRDDARLMDIVLRESDRLDKFVQDFLNFARPAKCEQHRVDLAPLLKDSVLLLQNHPDVNTARHAVRLELEDSQIPVTGNADQLKQVFWNVAQNALRAMPQGGRLLIKAFVPPCGGARVSFEDNGRGMTREEQEHLFQPFHSGFSGGTGLGLSITFQIMQNHRGSISVDSRKGGGTTVTLHLPPEEMSGQPQMAESELCTPYSS